MFENMFEDLITAKEEFTNRLSVVNEEISQKKEELVKIDDYKTIKGHLKFNTLWLFECGIAIIPAILMLTLETNIATVCLSLALGVGISLIFVERKDCKQMIKDNYKKYLGLSKKELKELEKVLNKELVKLKSISKNIDKELDKINDAIYGINTVNSELERIALLTNDSRIMEDREYLLNALEVSKNYTVQNYLNEKVDYSNIHFNNEIYEEKGKKLVKKL